MSKVNIRFSHIEFDILIWSKVCNDNSFSIEISAKLPTSNIITDGLSAASMGMLGARAPPTSHAGPASPPSSNITPPGVGSGTKPGINLGTESAFGQANMLSAALLGNVHPGSMMSGFPPTSLSSSGGGVSQHPPTPPRTPKTPLGGTSSPRFGLPPDHLKLAGVGAAPSSFNPASGNGMASGMPPLLSLAAIQDQVGKGAPNILASQLSKPPSMMLAGKSSEPCTTYNYLLMRMYLQSISYSISYLQ